MAIDNLLVSAGCGGQGSLLAASVLYCSTVFAQEICKNGDSNRSCAKMIGRESVLRKLLADWHIYFESPSGTIL